MRIQMSNEWELHQKLKIIECNVRFYITILIIQFYLRIVLREDYLTLINYLTTFKARIKKYINI